MAFYTKDNAIYLTRGDSMTLYISMTDSDGNTYTPVSTDVIRFALKHNSMTIGNRAYTDTSPILTKTIDYSTLALSIDPDDTADLEFGEYVYDIELTDADGAVDTFITASPFVILPEVD